MSEPADVFRALASPVRRRLLDLLRAAPATTGDLAAAIPELSRFAVMQHLEVLTEAGLVLPRKRGRHRVNHLNPVPLREWYERWVQPMADTTASGLLALRRNVEGDSTVDTKQAETAQTMDVIRTVRIETELRFRATPERVFDALTKQTMSWFAHTYGAERTKAVVFEPFVGGRHYEDWGDGAGHLYGHVTGWDAPLGLSLRGRLMPGVILDTTYELEDDDPETVLRVSKVAVGPLTEEEAASIGKYGNLERFADALRSLVEGQ